MPEYSVKFVPAAAEVPAALWDLFAPPVEGRWWYEALEQSRIEDQFSFFYGILSEGERAAGLAPAFLMDVPLDLVVPPKLLPVFNLAGKVLPSIKYQRTLFVGSPCSDEGTVRLVPGTCRRAAFRAFHTAIEAKAKALKAPMVVWKDFAGDYAEDLEWLAKEHGLFRLESFPGAAIALPSEKKEDYYAAMKASRRQKIKRKLRNSATAVRLSTEIVKTPPPGTLDEIVSLFSQTYDKADVKFEKLGRPFFEAIAGKPVSNFIILRETATAKMVAFMLCFAVGERLINKFIGIDYACPKEWVLYFRLWDAAVDWALERGFTSIQSGQTGYSAKIELGNELVPLRNYCRHRNGLINSVHRAVAKGISWDTLDPDLAAHLNAHPEVRAKLVPAAGKYHPHS